MRYLKFSLLLTLLMSSVAFARIPADKFFAPPQMITVKVSPNGKFIAYLTLENDNQVIYLQNVANKKRQKWLDISTLNEEEAVVRNLQWVDNQHLAATLLEAKKGTKDLIDTQVERSLLIIEQPTNNKTKLYSVRTSGTLLDPLPQQDNEFLFSKPGVYSKVYRLKIDKLLEYGKRPGKLTRVDGGQFVKKNEVMSIDGFITNWFIENDHSIKYGLRYLRNNTIELLNIENPEEPKTLTTWDLGEVRNADQFIVPVARAAKPGYFYALDRAEDNIRSVYLINYDSGDRELYFQTNSFNIEDLIIDPESNELLGILTLKDGLVQYEFINKDDRSQSATSINSVIDTSLNRSIKVAYSESHDQVGQFDLISNNRKLFTIGHRYSKELNRAKSKLVTGSYPVAGENIHYLLTLPKTAKASHSLILLPHGGPIGVHDTPYYDQVTHFLNNLGYAVLRVNYRGSSGYSKDFEEAGAKQWGELILGDLHAVTEQILKRKDINQNSACVMGMSYGGYAAMALPQKYPNTFKCAVAIAGVSDVALHSFSPYMTRSQLKWSKNYIGDATTEYQQLKAISPVYGMDKLSIPILIIHGEEDRTVDVEHAYRAKAMLEKYGKAFEFKVIPEAGHSFYDAEQRKEVFKLAQDFLAKYLR